MCPPPRPAETTTRTIERTCDTMEITEFQDGSMRCVCWQLPNHGWNDVAEKLDDFLAECFLTIEARYPDKPVTWVELNFRPDGGRLIVFPSDEGPFGDRNERICYQLFSDHLQQQFDQTCGAEDELKQAEWDGIEKKLWDRVGECLTAGKAHNAISLMRATHPMKIAGFNYNAGEGLFRLPHFDPRSFTEMQQQLADFKKQYEIP